MKKKNKISLIVIVLLIIITLIGWALIFANTDMQLEIDENSNLKIIKINDMKYPRYDPVIRNEYVYPNYVPNKAKITVFGGDINDNNIITEESFILNESNYNISERKIKEIKSYFGNNDNYLFQDKDNNVIVKLADSTSDSVYGVEIYNIKTGKMKFLKSKPTLNKEEVGDCIKVLDNYLFVWSGLNSDPENSRMEIIDLINDKKSTIPLKIRAGGIGNHDKNKKIIFMLGGVDNKTNKPTKEIQAIHLQKMTIENAGELIRPQVKPAMLYADMSMDGGSNASVDKNTVQIFSVHPFLDYYPKSVPVLECKKLPKELQNLELKQKISEENNSNTKLIFQDNKQKKDYITDNNFNNMKLLRIIKRDNQNVNYFKLDYKTLLLLIYEQK